MEQPVKPVAVSKAKSFPLQNVLFGVLFMVIVIVMAVILWPSSSKDSPPQTCSGKLDDFQLDQTMEYSNAGVGFGAHVYTPVDTRFLITTNDPGEFVSFRLVSKGMYDMDNPEKLIVETTSEKSLVSPNMGMTDSGKYKVFAASHLNVLEAIVFESNVASDIKIFGRKIGSINYHPQVTHDSNLVPGQIRFIPGQKQTFCMLSLPGPDIICQIGTPYQGELLVFSINQTTRDLSLVQNIVPHDPSTTFSNHFEMTATTMFLPVVTKTGTPTSLLEGAVEYHTRTEESPEWQYRQTLTPDSVTDTNMVNPALGFGGSLSIVEKLNHTLLVTSLSDVTTENKTVVPRPGVIFTFKLNTLGNAYEYQASPVPRTPVAEGNFGAKLTLFHDQYLFASVEKPSAKFEVYEIQPDGTLETSSDDIETPNITCCLTNQVDLSDNDRYVRVISSSTNSIGVRSAKCLFKV
jgi:hypothetical protein